MTAKATERRTATAKMNGNKSPERVIAIPLSGGAGEFTFRCKSSAHMLEIAALLPELLGASKPYDACEFDFKYDNENGEWRGRFQVVP